MYFPALLEAKSEYSMQGYGGLPLSELDRARWEFELELAHEEYKWIRSEIEGIVKLFHDSSFGTHVTF